ncbi:GH25 family lysozyme [Lederbergia wuyishanensis]|uniref:GH25 family lysozyme M1 (1,4-beta-N-acetylmuramidase) n=1 Tax=Lederbergia wuyishanensis TaxID=1347903 RepID=A0ABU0D729_9BACI|nr:GH25 family lysozyme [Lederbergia wuyishanensis]MCJ8008886.1 DUF5776 domain-containing protein [Lederbergia wuyishanensis]MDQ0344209.1 GH25 family lysozyme M1 (1,4-beta-N-acetylmuramidase) [Lederbergia wuyishanensis]
MGVIIDISHHQPPSSINYDKLAKQVDLVIIRTQYGSNTLDRHYKTHHKEFQKRGVPTAAYAWIRGKNVADMEKEATDFYNRTKEFNPCFWFLDVEEKTMADMRKGTSAFLKKLRSLGAKKVGIYVGHHLYKSFNLDLSEADAVWIPHYGKNNGTVNSKPAYPCDIHQYTDKGKLDGYGGYLDLNRIISNKKLEFFTGKAEIKPVTKPVEPTKQPAPNQSNQQNYANLPISGTTYPVAKDTAGYVTAADAKAGKNRKNTVKAGNYFVYNTKDDMINVTPRNGTPGSWINPADNKAAESTKNKTFRIRVKAAELWYYNHPDWNAKKATVKKGEVLTVVDTLSVNRSKMYKLISGNYITANTQYVEIVK